MAKVKSVNNNKVTPFELPPLPSIFTQPLGLEGWVSYEPVLLAALASNEPLLLIGPHGSAKSFLLERLASVLGLDYRFYNASLINYDDLVGIPMPDEERKTLKYITTPSAVWDAEIVFFDEINRTRPDLQNKLFPIIHERRIQGINLEKLKYRWAAMNPPPIAASDDDDMDIYFGAEPLDPALADRFSFLVEVPSWRNFTEEEKRRILRDQFTGEHPFPMQPAELVEMAEKNLVALQKEPSKSLEDYLLSLLSHLEKEKLFFSARRVTMLHRNILAVHASRISLYHYAYPEIPSQLLDWKTSALIALQNSIPQIAEGRTPDKSIILAAHRHAWEVARLDMNNPWRVLLQINDPVDRCISAIEMEDKIDDAQLSELVLDALAAQPEWIDRASFALAVYNALHKKRNLRATVYETLAQDLKDILKPGEHRHDPDVCSRERYRNVKSLCEKFKKEADETTFIRNRYAANLLMALLPTGFESKTPLQVSKTFFNFWDRLICASTESDTKGLN